MTQPIPPSVSDRTPPPHPTHHHNPLNPAIPPAAPYSDRVQGVILFIGVLFIAALIMLWSL